MLCLSSHKKLTNTAVKILPHGKNIPLEGNFPKCSRDLKRSATLSRCVSHIYSSTIFSHFSLFTFFMKKVNSSLGTKRNYICFIFLARRLCLIMALPCCSCCIRVKWFYSLSAFANGLSNYLLIKFIPKAKQHTIEARNIWRSEETLGNVIEKIFQTNRKAKQTSFIIKTKIYCFFVSHWTSSSSSVGSV